MNHNMTHKDASKFKRGDIVVGAITNHEDHSHSEDHVFAGRVGVITDVQFLDSYGTYEYELEYSDKDTWYYLEQDLEYEKNKIVRDILNDL